MSGKPSGVPRQDPLRNGNGNNYPLHTAAYFGNFKKVQQILLVDPFAVEELNPNSDNGNVLHSCARGGRENSHKIAEMILNALSSELRREFVTKKDASDKTPLYYAVESSHAPLVEFLLNTGFIDPPEESENTSTDTDPDNRPLDFSLTHLAVKNRAPEVLQLLLKSGFPAATFEDNQTPLHLCCCLQDNSDSDSDFDERITQCLKILTRVYSSEEINARRQNDKRTALHLAAESCNVHLLSALLQNKELDYLLKDPNTGKTALDYAVESCKKRNSAECVQMLMAAGTKQEGSLQRQRFCQTFSATESERCPLDLAFSIRSNKTVEKIVTAIPERKSWMEESDTIPKKYLTQMYEVSPEALPSLMTQCLTLSGDGSDVHADFGVIKGYCNDSTIETRYLRKVLNHPNKNTQKAILLHPLVQLFLEGKHKRLNWLNYASIIMQGIWLFLYTAIVATKYETHDDCDKNANSTAANGTNLAKPKEDECTSEDEPSAALFVTLVIFFITMTILVNLKEVAQLMNDGRSYFHESLNWLQMINFIVALTVGIVGLAVHPPIFFLVLAAFGFLMGCVLFLRGFATFDWCGIYIFAVGKVIPRTASLMLIFLPILIGFRQNLKILLPALKDQLSGNFQGVAKVLVVMTGEYDYNDIFEKKESKYDFFAYSGSFGFIVFVVIGFALLNTLTALTVDDISRLTKDARFQMAETRVKQIHHWEKFVSNVQSLPCLHWNLSRYLLLNDQRWRKDGDSTIILTTEKFISIMGETVHTDDLIRE